MTTWQSLAFGVATLALIRLSDHYWETTPWPVAFYWAEFAIAAAAMIWLGNGR